MCVYGEYQETRENTGTRSRQGRKLSPDQRAFDLLKQPHGVKSNDHDHDTEGHGMHDQLVG
jgi:hypothetical protein